MLQNRQLKYCNHINFKSQQFINTAQISDDENFLAIDGSAKKISIYYLKKRKPIKNMQLNGNISVIKFSEDSKILFCGLANGQLHVYDIIYKNIVGQGEIQEIISIDSENILTHQEKYIKITNIKENQNQSIIIKKNNSKFSIGSIEYDKLRDCVIHSEGKEIFFINPKDGKMQIICSNAHQRLIQQIQLFSNCNNLISSCVEYLLLWQIDYENRRLVKIQEFNNFYNSNFTSIFNNDKYVLICCELVYIIDKDFAIIQQINHNIQQPYMHYFQTRQLNSQKYIIVKAENELQVIKRGGTFMIQNKLKQYFCTIQFLYLQKLNGLDFQGLINQILIKSSLNKNTDQKVIEIIMINQWRQSILIRNYCQIFIQNYINKEYLASILCFHRNHNKFFLLTIKITKIKEKQQSITINSKFISLIEYDQFVDLIIYSTDRSISFINRKDGKIQIICSNTHIFSNGSKQVLADMIQSYSKLITKTEG